eukprot:jgi/Mesen1/4479/ME000228S03446
MYSISASRLLQVPFLGAGALRGDTLRAKSVSAMATTPVPPPVPQTAAPGTPFQRPPRPPLGLMWRPVGPPGGPPTSLIWRPMMGPPPGVIPGGPEGGPPGADGVAGLPGGAPPAAPNDADAPPAPPPMGPKSTPQERVKVPAHILNSGPLRVPKLEEMTLEEKVGQMTQ